jgi:signal transduction histidine kinase
MTALPPILLVDDSVEDRELVALVLRGAFGSVELLEAPDAASLARQMAVGGFGLVLTEHELPWIRATDVLRLVHDLRPGCPVVVLSRTPPDRVAAELWVLSPDGIVPKSSAGWVGLPHAVAAALGHRLERERDRAAELARRYVPERARGAGAAPPAAEPGPGPGAPGAEGAGPDAGLDEISYVVSHDLGRPLNQIQRFLELLDQDADGRLGKEARGWLEQARSSAARLEGMVAGVLRCARIESRGEAFAPVDLEAVLRLVLSSLDGDLAGAEVTSDPLPTVLADEDQMRQLFQNLIANALKFHGAAPPRVHVGAAEEGDRWHLWVRDNGIGIDPKDFQRIFVMFQRLHGEDEIPGNGIGLAICRRIVARHGGRIWVESQPNHGATFHLTLARNPGAEAPRAAAPGAAEGRDG